MAAPSALPCPTSWRRGCAASSAASTPAGAPRPPGDHFANPRNDFWRLLADSGLTPRQLDPSGQWSLRELGYGLTNAAQRTTKGSGDLRRGDFEGSLERLEGIASELRPRVIAFVGKAAYQGVFGLARCELGLQERALGATRLFVLPSTSPANAAIPYSERLRWFKTLAADLGRQGQPSGTGPLSSRPSSRTTRAYSDVTLESGWWERGAP